MIIYILTSAAVLTDAGESNSPEIRTHLFLSPLEAQLTMTEEFEAEIKEAEANGYTIETRDLLQTSAILSYGNISHTEVIWDITQQDIPISAFGTRGPNCDFIRNFVKNNGKPKGNKIILLMPRGDERLYIGGYQGANNEPVDDLVLEGDQLTVGTEYGRYGLGDLPADDLQEIRDKLENSADFIKAIQRYYQPELIVTKALPFQLASFEVFLTEEDCRTWLDHNGYLEGEYEIHEYSGDDIEDPTFINGDGKLVFCSE